LLLTAQSYSLILEVSVLKLLWSDTVYAALRTVTKNDSSNTTTRRLSRHSIPWCASV